MKYVYLLLLAVLFQSCVPSQLLFKNIPGLGDFKNFPLETLPKAEKPFQFESLGYNHLPHVDEWVLETEMGHFDSVEEFLRKTGTTSFMVVRNDTILYENYFNGYLMDKPAIVFSVTKSIVTSLLAQAIADGHIEDLSVPAYEYIPELKVEGKQDITLEHLVHMTSGLDFEDEEDLVRLTQAYWSKDVNGFAKKVKLEHEPGTHFAYKSVDTQLLSICIAEATGVKLSDYLQEKIWSPLGMEYDAYFTLDRPDGAERAFGGLAMCTRDLAKVARLFLNEGYWGKEQLIPQSYVQELGKREVAREGWWGYKFGWWMDSYIDRNLNEIRDYYAAGYRGQYIHVNPDNNLIIIRQGKKRDGVKWAAVMSKLGRVLDEASDKGHSFTVDEMNGKYEAADGSILKLKHNPDTGNWVVNDAKHGLYWAPFYQECPMSLTHRKHDYMIMFSQTGNEIEGLHLDMFEDRPTYYRKISDDSPSNEHQ